MHHLMLTGKTILNSVNHQVAAWSDVKAPDGLIKTRKLAPFLLNRKHKALEALAEPKLNNKKRQRASAITLQLSGT